MQPPTLLKPTTKLLVVSTKLHTRLKRAAITKQTTISALVTDLLTTGLKNLSK